MLEILDPTHEWEPAGVPRNQRPASLNGKTVGLLDIAKMRGDLFLNEVEHQLVSRGAIVKRYQKPTYAHPAPVALQQTIATECDVVLEALADWGSCTSCSVHDIVNLEARGIPSIAVVTEEFQTGAVAQGQALGFDPAVILVPHPIQDRTDDEMKAIALTVLDEIVAALTAAN